jgi:hypothetical protein
MKYTTVSGDGLSDWDVERLPENIVEAWSNYTSGDYEGSGWLLMLDDKGMYHLHNCSHCSCYGPTDEGVSSGHGETLIDMELNCTPEARAEFQDLIDAAKLTAKKQPWRKKPPVKKD